MRKSSYIEAFETKLLDTLNAKRNYVLGQYRVKGEKDRFVWVRGFEDMPRRKEALNSFFQVRSGQRTKASRESIWSDIRMCIY